MDRSSIQPSAKPSINDLARDILESELTVTAIYRNLSRRYEKSEIAEKLAEIARQEEQHSKFWRDFLANRDQDPNIEASNFKVTILSIIYRILGLGLTLKLLESGERRVIQKYSETLSSENLTQEEGAGILHFLVTELAHEEEFIEYEKRFKFFINQISTIFTQTSSGLVIVLSTAIGFQHLYEDSIIIGITGLIVGLISALNTFVSFYFFGVTGRRLKEDILNKINVTCSIASEAYLNRIKRIMREKYSDEVAEMIALEAKRRGLIERIIAEEEYGIKQELQNPLKSAVWASVFKTVAIILPLIPFFLRLPVIYAVPVSILITLILIAVAGSLAAIAADVGVKDKIFELVSGLIVMASITYILGKAASIILQYLNIG